MHWETATTKNWKETVATNRMEKPYTRQRSKCSELVILWIYCPRGKTCSLVILPLSSRSRIHAQKSILILLATTLNTRVRQLSTHMRNTNVWCDVTALLPFHWSHSVRASSADVSSIHVSLCRDHRGTTVCSLYAIQHTHTHKHMHQCSCLSSVWLPLISMEKVLHLRRLC